MNSEVVMEMMERRAMLEATIQMMNESGTMTMNTPDGPVKISEIKQDAKFIDMLLIDELEDMPISAVLLNIYEL